MWNSNSFRKRVHNFAKPNIPDLWCGYIIDQLWIYNESNFLDILEFFRLDNEIFSNFLVAEVKFSRFRLQGLQKGLASGGACRLRIHIRIKITSFILNFEVLRVWLIH